MFNLYQFWHHFGDERCFDNKLVPQENILEHTTESVKSNLTSDKFTSGKRNDKKFHFPARKQRKKRR